MMKKALVLALVLVSNLIFAQDTYLHCGTVLDVVSGKMLSEKTIVVSGKKIKSIENGYVSGGEDDNSVNLKDKTVLPGFIDMHVHIEGESSPTRYLDRFTKNDVDVAFQSTVYAKRTLMAGFTTVRDLGGSGVNIALRNAINKGVVIGPRIFTAGKVKEPTMELMVQYNTYLVPTISAGKAAARMALMPVYLLMATTVKNLPICMKPVCQC